MLQLDLLLLCGRGPSAWHDERTIFWHYRAGRLSKSDSENAEARAGKSSLIPRSSMGDDDRSYSELAELVHNGNADKAALLNELSLDDVPSRDDILRELEHRYLTPKDVLPDHWLSTYQM